MTDFDPEKLKHKPNEKHTLDEVLKSLQDLIHNDLLKGERAQPEEPAAPEPEPAPSPAAEETPAAAAPEEADPAAAIPDISLPAADMPLGAVVQSLEELVKNDLSLSDESGPMPAAAMPDSEPPAAPAPAPAAPTIGQQAFSFDDTGSSAPTEPGLIPAPLTVDEPEPSVPVVESSDFDEFTVDLAPPPGDFSKAENEVVEEIIAETPPDLPVLTDAVTEAAMSPVDDSRDGGGTTPGMGEVERRLEQLPGATHGAVADELPVLEEIALGAPENNPAAIAARVIARLNDNRRARGEAELDDATLDALRVLLREEIERHQSER